MGISDRPNLVVISKEKATFWMDGIGRWHNASGPFGKKKIIDYFNQAIQRDADGYFVTQMLGDRIEKVYFTYAETAIFVVDIVWADPIKLILNTSTELELDPAQLFINGDSLFCRLDDEIAKFGERALLSIAKYITFNKGQCTIRIGAASVELPELDGPIGEK